MALMFSIGTLELLKDDRNTLRDGRSSNAEAQRGGSTTIRLDGYDVGLVLMSLCISGASCGSVFFIHPAYDPDSTLGL